MKSYVNFRLAVSLGRMGYPVRYATSSSQSSSSSVHTSTTTTKEEKVTHQHDADVVYSPTDTFREDIYLEFNREMAFRGTDAVEDDIDRQRTMEVEQKRNVSRMRPWHQMLANKQVPPIQ